MKQGEIDLFRVSLLGMAAVGGFRYEYKAW